MGETALTCAVRSGELEIVRLMVESGALVNAANNVSQHARPHRGGPQGVLVNLCAPYRAPPLPALRRRPELEIPPGWPHAPPVPSISYHASRLHLPCLRPYWAGDQRAQSKVRSGAAYETFVASPQTGFSSIILAASNGHLDIVRLLLERGADVNTATKARCSV